MALGPRLDLRQSQSLVMTPQLQQAIKLLALSNLEIEAFIGEALDANPLLEMGEGAPDAGLDSAFEGEPEALRRTTLETSPVDQLVSEGRAAEDRPLDIDASALDRDRDTGDGPRSDFTDSLGDFGGSGAAEAVVPDILVEAVVGEDGAPGWDIALNPATLPRLVVNRRYYVEMRHACVAKDAKAWLGERLADANWLLKALDQRQKTILKVAAEIVKQQEGFFRLGVAHLKPLTLRTVAEAITMHESTVSRVTSNKYLHCARGTFELKYFFTSGVASADGDGAVSAEAVKAAIRQLIDAEDPKAVLSDDALVDLLNQRGFDLARRTVAKYREAIGLGSSVQRRRQKALAGVR